jgi:hypothetical protein
MARWQKYLLIVAVGIAGVAVGLLMGAGRDRALHYYRWDAEIELSSSNAVANRIRIVSPFDAGEGRFSYYTGGHSPGDGGAIPAPRRTIAEAAHGAVTVRLLAFEPHTGGRATDAAMDIARIVSFATTEVWPRQPTPVEVDMHVMPDDAPFSQARRVDWRQGDPYVIAVFARNRVFAETAAHELYHVLAGRWARGQSDPTSAARPNATRAYEEVAADLFAQCGVLLATGYVSLDTRNTTVVIAGQRFENSLDGEELSRALDLLSRDEPGSHMLRALLVRTVLADVFGEAAEIARGSPQAERLLTWCREAAADPWVLAERLHAL